MIFRLWVPISSVISAIIIFNLGCIENKVDAAIRPIIGHWRELDIDAYSDGKTVIANDGDHIYLSSKYEMITQSDNKVRYSKYDILNIDKATGTVRIRETNQDSDIWRSYDINIFIDESKVLKISLLESNNSYFYIAKRLRPVELYIYVDDKQKP